MPDVVHRRERLKERLLLLVEVVHVGSGAVTLHATAGTQGGVDRHVLRAVLALPDMQRPLAGQQGAVPRHTRGEARVEGVSPMRHVP